MNCDIAVWLYEEIDADTKARIIAGITNALGNVGISVDQIAFDNE